ncbi:DUF6274 family protein [Streptomyces sp. NK08204]|uniref:DUF6274 family protein n=1 Tax=Streptomyces sp. NK08204 TaxID=2873260 RepID=UPI001CEC4F9C|nr:DUF6274 family protein [Streptomyces sp. NK08204]
MAASVRHETRALLRAHLSAASSYRHLTRCCPICRQLLRLAMDSAPSTPGHLEPGHLEPEHLEPEHAEQEAGVDEGPRHA